MTSRGKVAHSFTPASAALRSSQQARAGRNNSGPVGRRERRRGCSGKIALPRPAPPRSLTSVFTRSPGAGYHSGHDVGALAGFSTGSPAEKGGTCLRSSRLGEAASSPGRFLIQRKGPPDSGCFLPNCLFVALEQASPAATPTPAPHFSILSQCLFHIILGETFLKLWKAGVGQLTHLCHEGRQERSLFSHSMNLQLGRAFNVMLIMSPDWFDAGGWPCPAQSGTNRFLIRAGKVSRTSPGESSRESKGKLCLGTEKEARARLSILPQ